MKISIRRGLNVTLRGAPAQTIIPANAIGTVGMLGADYPNLRAELLVAQGDRVAVGMPLFHDRKRPDIFFAAAQSGIVTGINIGAKRRLTSLTIAVTGKECKRFTIPTAPDRDQSQRLLLESGVWPSFLARPFGRIPDPGSAPDAIFVTAMDTRPHAVDANVVLAGHLDAFARGATFLTTLTVGPIFVCQAPGAKLVREDGQIRCAQFSGPHPAGLAGTHIHRLFPLRDGRSVWQIHYQDVIALGRLLETGKLFAERVISLAGPGVRHPRLVRVPPGANLDDLFTGELTEGAKHILSGSALLGRESRFLGRYHWQVTALPREQAPHRRSLLGALGVSARPKPIVPTEALEHALGPDIPVIPLVRALSVGDAETAARLGCLELLEEDMALVTYATGGTQDFSALLRSALNILEA